MTATLRECRSTHVQDPDAPTRQQRKLSELDVKDELALNKHLFTCIRAGQLDEVATCPVERALSPLPLGTRHVCE